MGPDWVVSIKILYRIGVLATCVDLALTASASPAKITNPASKSWKFIYPGPPPVLFCSLEPVDCHFLRSDLTKNAYSIILEETRMTVVESVLCFQAGPGNKVDEGFCSEASAVLQPTQVLGSKSIACVCVAPLVLLLHSKAEKSHPSSLLCYWSWRSHGGGRWSSVLHNSTEHCKLFCQGAVFLLLGEHDRYSLLPSVLLWTAMVIAQPCLIGICLGHSISSIETVSNNL